LRIELLTQLSTDLRTAVEREWLRLDSEKTRIEIENKLLKEELRLLRIEKYGPKSEQLSDAQLELLEGEPGVAAAEIEAEAQRPQKEKQEVEKVRRHPGRAPLPAHLPRRENVILCTPEQCLCAQCGAEKQVIGYDSSEELDVEPVKYFGMRKAKPWLGCR
jgi:transposase